MRKWRWAAVGWDWLWGGVNRLRRVVPGGGRARWVALGVEATRVV